MKHLAPHDRPREKLERLGASGLGDNELLALILGSGSRETGALALANAILARVGGLQALHRTTIDEFQQVDGIGRARAAQVIAAVELGRRTLVRSTTQRPRLKSPTEVAAYLGPQYGTCPVEQFGVVMLDSKNHVIRIRIISIGSLDEAIVHPREVFREAVSASAAAVILFHNHPSGDPSPSPDDVALTARLVSAGELLGINVLDHVILTERRYFSLLDSGRALVTRPPPPASE